MNANAVRTSPPVWARFPGARLRAGIAGMVFAVAALAGAGTALADEPVVVKIVARDGIYTPPNLEVPAGVRIKIEIVNEGKEPMEFESLPLKIEKVLAPGAASSVVIHRLRPGRYPFWDEFHPDTSKGYIVAR